MKIAIVILNWNGKALLEQFVPSVLANSKAAEIYVVDNASTDGSIEFLKHTFSEITIIQNEKNFGFAKGYNEGLKSVNADIFCLLNSDVAVSKNWLSPVTETFVKNDNIAIVQPKILDYNNPEYFEYAGAAGGFIDKLGYPYCRGRIFNTLEKDAAQYDDTTSIFWASGACFFIKATVFKQLGGFDDSFFSHMEEIDLCWRAKNRGFDVFYNGHSKVYHIGGASLSDSNPKKTFLNFRNSLFTLVKNGKGPIGVLVLARLILDGVAGIQFLCQLRVKHFFAIIKAHFSFYVHLPALLKQRSLNPKKIKYYQKTSIVWSYFINKKRYFTSL